MSFITRFIGCGALSLLVTVCPAFAQTYPVKPVKIITGGSAGSPGDIFARTIGQKLSEALGQPFVIENRAGANYRIATEAVSKAAPDGYTLLLTASPHTINPALYHNLAFDPIKDFAPITLIADTPLVVVVNPEVPARSVKELLTLAKTRPGKLNFGSAGSGSGMHLAGEMFVQMGGVKIVHVPYKGSTGAITDLVGGVLTVVFSGGAAALPLVKDGKLRALATTGATRTAAAPDLPTVSEAGLPGYEISTWYGILAPAGTSSAIVSNLHNEIVKILHAPGFKTRWLELGADVVYNKTPEDFTAFLKADIAKWEKIVKEGNIRVE